MLADVAFAVGVNNIFGRHFPPRHGLLKFLPVFCAVERERAEVSGGAGLRADPVQRQRALRVLPEHRAVAREFQFRR